MKSKFELLLVFVDIVRDPVTYSVPVDVIKPFMKTEAFSSILNDAGIMLFSELDNIFDENEAMIIINSRVALIKTEVEGIISLGTLGQRILDNATFKSDVDSIKKFNTKDRIQKRLEKVASSLDIYVP